MIESILSPHVLYGHYNGQNPHWNADSRRKCKLPRRFPILDYYAGPAYRGCSVVFNQHESKRIAESIVSSASHGLRKREQHLYICD
jgi:hypothetical protein